MDDSKGGAYSMVKNIFSSNKRLTSMTKKAG